MHLLDLAFYVVTGIASILGAILSWHAWRSAESAREAARDALTAAHSNNAADVLKELNQSASELLGYIQDDNFQPAIVRARDLFSRVGTARTRWHRFLDQDAVDKLDGAQEKIRKISLGLTPGEGPVQPEVKQKLLFYCHGVIKTLSDESSRMVAKLEQKEEEK